jgi:hypothetical protein
MTMTTAKTTLRIKVSPEVARVVSKNAPRELRMSAARGESSLPPGELPVALFFLLHGEDSEIRALAAATLKRIPAQTLAATAANPDSHPRFLDLIARLRLDDPEVLKAVLSHPAVDTATILFAAAHGDGEVTSLVADLGEEALEIPGLLDALLANPRTPSSVGKHLEKRLETPLSEPDDATRGEDPGEEDEGEEDLNLSKYQMSLEMGVSEKIKVAMTGDKEWRNILIREANKLVSTAVMKNPRITEGEVLAVAKNRSSSDELIRLITLNREWLKNYEIKKALVMHPRTPLPKALRYMSILTEKDVKNLAKSRNVSQIIVNNARRMLMAKEKKGR